MLVRVMIHAHLRTVPKSVELPAAGGHARCHRGRHSEGGHRCNLDRRALRVYGILTVSSTTCMRAGLRSAGANEICSLNQ